MTELPTILAVFSATGLIGGLLATAVGVLAVIVVAEGARAEPPSKPRLIPLWIWLAFWIPLGLILLLTDMPHWLRFLLFFLPAAITAGLIGRRAA